MRQNARKHITNAKGATFRGRVVSDKMQNTVVVAVERYIKLPKLGKYTRKTKRYSVHAPNGSLCKVGDIVSIRSCRPISKTKVFILGKE